MAERLEFRCPHCRRAYSLELDAAKLARLDRIAVCGRCRKPFSLAKRVREATDEPPTAEPEVSERDLRDAMVKKRERERARREELARQALARARDAGAPPLWESRSPARRSETAPREARRDSAPQSSPGKRRWDSVPNMRAVRTPPQLPVRERRAPDGVTRRDAQRREAERSTPPSRERASQPTDVFSLARERAETKAKSRSTSPPAPKAPEPLRPPERPEAKVKSRSTSRPAPEPLRSSEPPRSLEPPRFLEPQILAEPQGPAAPPIPADAPSLPEPPRAPEPATRREPPRSLEPPLTDKSPMRRRVTHPGLGVGGATPSPPPSTPARISAPSPRRVPTPPPFRTTKPESTTDEATGSNERPPSEPAPPRIESPEIELAAALASALAADPELPDTLRPETTSSELPTASEAEDFDDLYDEEDLDGDGGDRPTLLLPDEAVLRSMVGGGDAPASAAAAPPRNAAARVVMSRKDWILAADPGLGALAQKHEPEVAALVALLDLAPLREPR